MDTAIAREGRRGVWLAVSSRTWATSLSSLPASKLHMTSCDVCDMTQLCVQHESFIRVQHESFIRVRCLNVEYGVATISRLLKIIGLFCRISSLV